ncbi:MAG: hypothetical protein U0840_12390 [Gemmataceae bacterium]
MHIVLIETSGNQNYIFATNTLRENVGASQLTYEAGITFIKEAISGVAGITTVVSASGKAILLAENETVARTVVSHVTLKALKVAPGLDVRGVIGSAIGPGDSLHDRIKEAHRLLDQLRSRLPGPAVRFQRLPVVAECATSGLPAATIVTHGHEPGARSAVSIAKLTAAQHGLNRIRDLVQRSSAMARLPNSTTELEDLGCDWLAVVHADGNGLGQVFLDFDQFTSGNDHYRELLRAFSQALDRCTEQAFCKALAVLRPRGKHEVLPIVPLVLGGDDLTVVVDGRQALKFTRTFLDAFEHQTAADPCVSGILTQATKQAKLTSCAGVAIVKPHYPFHAAYELAESLLKQAKAIAKDPSQTRPPFSALDFHVLYDASGPDLERIRAELTVDEGTTCLIARPYAITSGVDIPRRHWDDLCQRVAAVRARDINQRQRLPNSMLHELREGLFFGRLVAEGRLGLVRERYRNQQPAPQVPDIDWLLVNGRLFWEENGGYRTALLDALDVAKFWEGQQ